jgi:tetratricopeptide (TPR) repeat protein
MGKLRVDQVTALLPELDELRPLRDRLVADSIPDPDRKWTASGELGTLGRRLVRSEGLEEAIPELVRALAGHTASIYEELARAIVCLEKGDESHAVDHLLEAAAQEERASRLDRCEAFALAAHEIARRMRDRLPAVRTLRQAARAARGQGRLEKARVWYEEAHDIARALGRNVEAAVNAIGRGNISVDRGLWSDAEVWYERALELLGSEPRKEHWHVYLNLSIVHRSLGELDRSAEWLTRAESTAAEFGDSGGGAILKNARGQILMASGDMEAAELLFRQALELAGDVAQARVVIGVNLGEALLEQGRILEAEDVARTAEESAIASNVVTRLPEVYRLLGAIAGARMIEDGFVFFEQALDLVRERALPDFEKGQTLEAYGSFALGAGRRGEADARLRDAARIYDALGSRHFHERVLGILGDMGADTSAPPDGEDNP